jgi:adenylate cyclase
MTNKILVHNILPVHVAEIYLSRRLRNEFYNEEYDNVAVCFATIKHFVTSNGNQNEQMMLKSLNDIICSFDETLINFNGYQKIEKIKVNRFTYMVACGLDPGRGDSGSSLNGLQDGRRSFNMSIYTNTLNKNRRKHKTSVRQSNNVVVTLTEFALELMRVLRKFNNEKFKNKKPLELRVGISYGSVMAGVVGASKPLYDIWGNTVNMASRLDTTNVPGKIQVAEDSANILTSFGYVCELRGETFIKGIGEFQ